MSAALWIMVAGLAVDVPAPAPLAGRSIEKVVVFADRAEVTRASTATCVGGTASALFEGLPDAVDPRTLRGDVDGDAIAVGVSSAREQLKEALDARVQSLRNELTDLDDQLTALQRSREDDAQRMLTLNSYGAYFRAMAREELRDPKPDLVRWDQLLNSLDADHGASVTAEVQRAARERTLMRKRERVAERLGRLQPASAPSSTAATVAVRCGSASTVKVRLSYVVPGATWQPEYDLRFTGPAKQKTGEGKAALTVAGVVTQASGEDWSDAEVWLSTAKPLLGGEAPLPNPITVNGAPEDKQKTLVQAQEKRPDELKQGNTRAAAGPQGASLEDGGKAFVLKLKKRVTIHADGRPYWFPVDELTTSATSSLVAVPARAPWVYQVAKLNNPAAFPLLAGRVHVFRGPTFVGNVSLEYRAPGEPLEVSLGIDEEVALERQDLLKQKREAGFLSGSQTVASAWRTIIHNRSEQEVSVELREQIPVSKTADIVVTLDNDKTGRDYTLDKLRGHLTWKLNIKRNGTEQRDLAYSIALPKEWKLQ